MDTEQTTQFLTHAKIPRDKCWYKIDIEECVLCGRQGETRTRMPLPKPENHEERYSFKQYVCGSHFL